MDELDLLLEELALKSATAKNLDENKSNEASYGELPPPVYAGYDKQSKGSGCSNTYSDLPAPVAASMNPASVTNELDIIMQDLLGQQDVGPSPTPLPLTQKESVKRKKEGGQQQKTESSSTAGSCVKASKKTDAIDDMLGGLSSDLEKIGVRTVAKGHCASCNKCIVGKMITALGEVWHSEHFVCAVCKTELATARFFEREGQPYCDKDYHQLFSPRCAYCKGPILQNILTALDQNWHPEHFFCACCGCLFGPEGFHEKDGKPYCRKDFYHLFAPKCSGCGESVMEKYLTAANGTWHPECFVCADCLKPFTDGCFMELDGRPLCSLHFHSRQGTLCAGCGEPITSRCISALNRKFHPEHFVCAFCLRQLSQGIFTEQKGKPYCSACYNKLFV
ncbi:leupaxin isoform X1 [Thalassophryne amazonica]|uniref:leupaxin isoform X1 n=1 Tax=Thalassophryne amazonica TaxID=390379 RepID=UPI0014724EDC|nr:leupaxin isoform X1 [Thalassophryne amazonica]